MTVAEMRSAVARYLDLRTSDSIDETLLTISGYDLLKPALNNARRAAEMRRDWVLTQTTWTVSVDPDNGVDISGLVTQDVGDASEIKAIETVYLLSDDGEGQIPIEHNTARGIATEARERLRVYPYVDRVRYNTQDARNYPIRTRSYQVGQRLYLNPKPDEETTIYIDGYKWMADYEEEDDEDFFLQRGAEYMMWSAVVEVNHAFQSFVPQKEGNMGPPLQMAQKGFDQLVAWDDQMIQRGRMFRLR